MQQHREAVGKELLEIPSGILEQGKIPVDCVRHELRKETGYSPKYAEEVGGFCSTSGFCTEYLSLYLATELEYDSLYASGTDKIQVERMPLHMVSWLLASSRIEDAKSIA